MNRFKTALVFMSALGMLAGTSSAFACTPPPAYMLKAVTIMESKLPVRVPSMTGGSPFGNCPHQVWPFEFNSLTDAEITQYLGSGASTPPLPAWNATTVYLAGDSTSSGGKNYRARWWTQGEMPSATSAVWQEITDAAGNPAGWSASVAYAAGAQVTYQASIYKAKWWTQGEIPGASQWGAWEKIGAASGMRPAVFHASSYFITGGVDNIPTIQVDWSTDMFTGGDYSLADNWKVRINGVEVQQSTSIVTRVGDCVPGSNPCLAAYVQSGSFTIPAGRNDQVTFWLCTGDSCRMTPRLNWYASGSIGQEPPF